MRLKNKFETALVNEPSVFEPLKFYCMMYGPRDRSIDDLQLSVLNQVNRYVIIIDYRTNSMYWDR